MIKRGLRQPFEEGVTIVSFWDIAKEFAKITTENWSEGDRVQWSCLILKNVDLRQKICAACAVGCCQRLHLDFEQMMLAIFYCHNKTIEENFNLLIIYIFFFISRSIYLEDGALRKATNVSSCIIFGLITSSLFCVSLVSQTSLHL